MKISVCGKGGSGKSTVVTLLANVARDRGYQVLVVDSDDSNFGLHRMLGFDTLPLPLIELAGGKRSVRRQMRPGFYGAESEDRMGVLAQDNMSTEGLSYPYIVRNDGIGPVSIGKILHSLDGCACPMGVLSGEFLKKLRLKDKELTDRVITVVGAIHNDPEIIDACFEGRPLRGSKATEEIQEVLDSLLPQVKRGNEGK